MNLFLKTTLATLGICLLSATSIAASQKCDRNFSNQEYENPNYLTNFTYHSEKEIYFIQMARAIQLSKDELHALRLIPEEQSSSTYLTADQILKLDSAHAKMINILKSSAAKKKAPLIKSNYKLGVSLAKKNNLAGKSITTKDLFNLDSNNLENFLEQNSKNFEQIEIKQLPKELLNHWKETLLKQEELAVKDEADQNASDYARKPKISDAAILKIQDEVIAYKLIVSSNAKINGEQGTLIREIYLDAAEFKELNDSTYEFSE